MNCEYVCETYGVPACIGRIVTFKGRKGIISADRGNYKGVTFDDQKPGCVSNFHPETEGLEYGDIGKVRKMTRGQQRYQSYLRAECCESFADWMGFKPKEHAFV